MKAHPLCEMLPPMSDADYTRLRDDIKAHGMREPIVEFEGQILDGRHRFRACAELGIKPSFKPYAGDDPAGYVYSSNVAHRHLSKTQLGIVAAKLKGYYAEQAALRMKAGTDPMVNSPQGDAGTARDLAGKACGVSGTTVDEAEAILKRGIPELIDKVTRGLISINQGQQIAKMSKSRQLEIVSLPNKKAINHALKTSASRRRPKKRQQDNQPGAATVPGSALVKNMLTRLENMSAEIERSGMSPEEYTRAFVEQFDWQEPLLVRRMAYAEQAIRCIVSLDIMSKRAKRTAA